MRFLLAESKTATVGTSSRFASEFVPKFLTRFWFPARIGEHKTYLLLKRMRCGANMCCTFETRIYSLLSLNFAHVYVYIKIYTYTLRLRLVHITTICGRFPWRQRIPRWSSRLPRLNARPTRTRKIERRQQRATLDFPRPLERMKKHFLKYPQRSFPQRTLFHFTPSVQVNETMTKWISHSVIEFPIEKTESRSIFWLIQISKLPRNNSNHVNWQKIIDFLSHILRNNNSLNVNHFSIYFKLSRWHFHND